MALENIRIVLVGPTHPGNIGAVARSMKTMGLNQMWLVAPRNFPSPEATARAAGADDILDTAKVCATLEEAVVSCQTVVATSARSRRIQWPTMDPASCARELVAQAMHGNVALVFGRERAGLTNQELDRCGSVVKIPTSSEYSSLNLAAAVQIMAYELRVAILAGGQKIAPPVPQQPVTHEDMERFYQHLETVLVEINFLDPEHPRKLMRRLYRVFNRASLDQREINILRGILTAIQRSRQC